MRHLFLNDPNIIYMNSGTESKTPLTVLAAIQKYRDEYELNPTAHFVSSYRKLWNIQMRLGHFFNCQADELFLRNNVTEVMNQFILGTPLPANSEILVSNLEYQAIANCVHYRAKRDGLKVRIVELPVGPDLTPDQLLNTIAKYFSPKSSMLVISHIFTGTGMVVPIAELSELTYQHGIKLAVDGAHSPGSLKIDFGRMPNLDFFGGNFHKWMMGPKGSAFGWCHKKYHDTLAPLMAGWTTFETISPYDTFGGGSRFASKMMPQGTQNFCQFLGLDDLLDFHLTHGEERLRHMRHELTLFAESNIRENTQLKSLYPQHPDLQGPLITFALPDHLESEGYHLMHRLHREFRLQVSSTKIENRWHLRISPHLYNNHDEISQALSILKLL